MSKDLLTIYWVTDLHILDTTNRSRPIRGLRHGILNIPEGGDRLAAFVTRVNLDRPDVVLCTGDIIDSHDYWLQKHREAQTTDGETFFEPRSSKSNACVGLSEPSKESVFFHFPLPTILSQNSLGNVCLFDVDRLEDRTNHPGIIVALQSEVGSEGGVGAG